MAAPLSFAALYCMRSMSPDPNTDPPPRSPLATGLSGRCPRCGEGKLFDGYLSPARACQSCGLDYGFADSGDGPAFFVMTAVGFLVVALALVVEIAWRPPYWVHAALWLPLLLGSALVLLRLMKGVLIAQQYATKAAEGRLDGSGG